MEGEYLSFFVAEARENLEAVVADLIELETASESEIAPLVGELFRRIHNLKGMAATVGLGPMTHVAHRMEDLMERCRSKGTGPTPDVVDIFLAGTDAMREMVELVAVGEAPDEATDIVTRLDSELTGDDAECDVEEGPAEVELDADHPMPPPRPGGIRFIVTLVDGCALPGARAALVLRNLEGAGRILAHHPSEAAILTGQHGTFAVDVADLVQPEVAAAGVRAITDVASVHTISGPSLERDDEEPVEHASPGQRRRSSVRVEVGRLDELMNLVGELVIGRGQLESHMHRVGDPRLTDTVGEIARTISDIQAAVARARMTPLEGTFERMKRVVRDTSRDLDRPVAFAIAGGDTELDRSMVDAVADPLLHLIRNAIDHGIEDRETRVQNGKPEEGQISLEARSASNHVVIEVSDDGCGIDGAKVAKSAVGRGLVTPDEVAAMSPEEVRRLIFLPGLSTKETVSTISGRGVGMDVVLSSVSDLGGTIEIDSHCGRGTTFRVLLPLSLAVVESLQVAIGGEVWAVPISDIEETIIARTDDVDGVLGSPVLRLRDDTLPLVHGRTALAGLPAPQPSFPVLVVNTGSLRFALSVDRLAEKTDIVVRPIPEDLQGVPHVSGVTILGDGKVGLILDVKSLSGAPTTDSGRPIGREPAVA